MKKGFTLAEVLITLGIIGVVAALTIPSMIAEHKNKETVVRLQKAISVLNNGMRKMLADEGVFDIVDTELVSVCGEVLNANYECQNKYYSKYFNIINYKDYLSISKIKCLDNSSCAAQALMSFGMYSFVTSDGILYVPRSVYGATIDINGKKGPNQFGRDIFVLDRNSNGIFVPHGSDTWDNPSSSDYCNPQSGKGLGCAARIVAKGWKIDY